MRYNSFWLLFNVAKINFAMSNISLAFRNILSKKMQAREISTRAHGFEKIISAHCRFYSLVYEQIRLSWIFFYSFSLLLSFSRSKMRFEFYSLHIFDSSGKRLHARWMMLVHTRCCSYFDGASRNDRIYRVQIAKLHSAHRTRNTTCKNESKICKCNHPKPQTRIEHIDIDICVCNVHTANHIERDIVLHIFSTLQSKHPISIFVGPKKQRKPCDPLKKAHTNTRPSRESIAKVYSASMQMQHSTVYIAQSKCTKITICLAAGQPLNTDHHISIASTISQLQFISCVCECADGLQHGAFAFLWNQFQDILPDSENWFHFRNLYLWTNKTQTTVWIHCIVKQSISLYSDGLVRFGSDRFKHSEFHFLELIIIVHINWFPLKISNEKLSAFLFYSRFKWYFQ